MPKEILNLNDFSVGLIDDTDPRDIPLNALAEANNVSFKRRNEINTLGGLISTTDATKGDLITFLNKQEKKYMKSQQSLVKNNLVL